MKIEICEEAKTAICVTMICLALASMGIIAIYTNEVSWRKAVAAGLQQKQCVGEGGKIWVK